MYASHILYAFCIHIRKEEHKQIVKNCSKIAQNWNVILILCVHRQEKIHNFCLYTFAGPPLQRLHLTPEVHFYMQKMNFLQAQKQSDPNYTSFQWNAISFHSRVLSPQLPCLLTLACNQVNTYGLITLAKSCSHICPQLRMC